MEAEAGRQRPGEWAAAEMEGRGCREGREMNFRNYITAFDVLRNRDGRQSFKDFYEELNSRTFHLRNDSELYSLCFAKSVVEPNWYVAGRPYYKVWPSILPAFLRLNLDVPASAIEPRSKAILVRFAEGSEPSLPLGGKLLCILAVAFQKEWLTKLFVIYRFDDGDGLANTSDGSFAIDYSDETLEVLIENEYAKFNDVDNGKFVMRIIGTLFLLENDPSIIQPDVLAADRDRFDNSTDPELRQRLIDKARKRGVVGWRIGESYETIPHYRRPHFGLRYTGTGGTIPRIVPIKGAVVHRQKLTQVPTGYIRPDGTEAE